MKLPALNRCEKASLTVEAALIMPIFLYFIIAFLYLLQVLLIQEHIQSSITKMGLSLSKTAYVYKDFEGIEEALNFDETVFDDEFDLGLRDLAESVANGAIIRAYATKYLNADSWKDSIIQDGFRGISFYDSEVLTEEDCIDIVVRYRIKLPLRIFVIDNIRMIQRVKIRAWTGKEIPALYQVTEEKEESDEEYVYITESGTVYHTNKECSHIKLSVCSVIGIPKDLKNSYGRSYGPCELCCEGELNPFATYYITSDGIRYHTINSCSGIKRNVKEIKRSEAGNRPLCKRCGK